MKKIFCKALVSLLALKCPAAAFADAGETHTVRIAAPVKKIDNDQLADKFKKDFLKLLGDLGADEISSINEIPVSQLEQSIGEIQIQFVQSLDVSFPSVPGAVRRVAYWDAPKKTIYVNASKIFESQWVGLHEFMGINQGGDWNFSKTAEVLAYKKMKEVEADGKPLAGRSSLNIIKQQLMLRQGNGGVTGVGGGGDYMPLLFKSDLIVAGANMYNEGFISEREFEGILMRVSVLTVELDLGLSTNELRKSDSTIMISPSSYMVAYVKKTKEMIQELVVSWVHQYRNP
jgi:hypothetical protein